MEKTIKARVKATGKIVEVKSKVITSPCTGDTILKYVDQKTGISYFEEDLFFPMDLVNDPDYWTRLEHQYAGMAMQGMLNNSLLITSLLKVNKSHEDIVAEVTDTAFRYAHALVEKYKKEEK